MFSLQCVCSPAESTNHSRILLAQTISAILLAVIIMIMMRILLMMVTICDCYLEMTCCSGAGMTPKWITQSPIPGCVKYESVFRSLLDKRAQFWPEVLSLNSACDSCWNTVWPVEMPDVALEGIISLWPITVHWLPEEAFRCNCCWASKDCISIAPALQQTRSHFIRWWSMFYDTNYLQKSQTQRLKSLVRRTAALLCVE